MSQWLPLAKISLVKSGASGGQSVSGPGSRVFLDITESEVEAMFAIVRLEEGATASLAGQAFLRLDVAPSCR